MSNLRISFLQTYLRNGENRWASTWKLTSRADKSRNMFTEAVSTEAYNSSTTTTTKHPGNNSNKPGTKKAPMDTNCSDLKASSLILLYH